MRTGPAVLIATLALMGGGSVHAEGGGATSAVIGSGAGLTVTAPSPARITVIPSLARRTIFAPLAAFIATDSSGSGRGWHIQILATRFTCVADGADGRCPAGGDPFPAGSMVIAPPTVACHAGMHACSGRAAAPEITVTSATAIDTDGSAVTVASAAPGTGMGSYDVTPGAIGTGQLEIVAPARADASEYSSTLIVSIASGP